MYPLFNKNLDTNFVDCEMKLMELRMNTSIKRLNTLYSKNSSNIISISDTAKQYSLNQRILSSTTELKGQPVKELTANNNVLDISRGSYYKFKTDSGKTVILTSEDGSFLHTQTSDLELDENCGLQPSDECELTKKLRLISDLADDKTAFDAHTDPDYTSGSDFNGALSSFGIKPGWFEIKYGEKSNEFYLTNDGEIYPEYQIKEQTSAFKTANWFKDEIGYSSKSVFIIDGKQYKLDENGYLNLPDGVDCVMENIKIIK